MKNILLFVLVFCCCIPSGAQDLKYERHWKKGMEKIRIMSYNIFNGFAWGEDKDREDRLAEWVKAKDPEILGLQELCGFTQESLSKTAARWGHPYCILGTEKGHSVGITSKHPIELVRKVEYRMGHCMLHVRTYGIDIVVCHLNPFSTEKRREQAGLIAGYIREHALDSCILMGDMNSHSPMDADYMEDNAIGLTAKYGGQQSHNLLDGRIDYSVISQFLALPLIDVCRRYVVPEKRFSFPTPVLMTQSRHPEVRKRTHERLDYIFASPAVARLAVDAFIFNDGETDYLSDHFPVAMDLVRKVTGK